MITVINPEFEQIKHDAEQSLKSSSYRALHAMQSGVSISKFSTDLKVKLSCLVAIRGYATGKFQSEEYFNQIGPDDISSIFNLLST